MNLTPNMDRLRELEKWVSVEHEKKLAGLPSEWNQELWISSCGTACCLAGKQAQLEGGVPFGASLGRTGVYRVVIPSGEVRIVGDYAQETLGLSYEQRGALFDEANTLADIGHVIDQIESGEL